MSNGFRRLERQRNRGNGKKNERRGKMLVYASVEKDVVKDGDISGMSMMMQMFRQDRDRFRNLFFLTFAYDDDPREVYEIPEIRRYVERLFGANPDLFWYLNDTVVLSVALCLMECKVVAEVGKRKKIQYAGTEKNRTVMAVVEAFRERPVFDLTP